MKEIILERLEYIRDKDTDDSLGLKNFNIREDFSINYLFRQGSSTTAQINKVPTKIIVLVNRWKKVERAKGKRAKMTRHY